MKRTKLTAVFAAFLVACSGCGAGANAVPYDPAVFLQNTSPASEDQAANTLVDMVQPMGVTADSGRGALSYVRGVAKLTGEQESLILDYMDTYYASLAKLEAKDVTGFFSKAASHQALEAQSMVEAIVGLRSMQSADLSLRNYSYALSVTGVSKDEDGYTKVRVLENYVQKFRAYPESPAEGFLTSHTFLLTNTNSGWRLREHRQMDSLRRLVLGSIDGSTDPEASVKYYLSTAKKAVKARKTQGTARNPAADNAYNRSAAAKYAGNWVGVRKSGWPNYNWSGGNCMNFVSQCLYAGGIPMDYTSPGVWKYFGSTPNNSAQPSGRSASWSSVSSFLSYARSNTGFGLVSVVDAPYYSGEVGDVIHMSAGGSFRHTVIITKVIKDEDGKTVDYLVSSNTADVKNFPASAYHYAEQTLIKIVGWNNAPEAPDASKD